jgi:hypothetical protein
MVELLNKVYSRLSSDQLQSVFTSIKLLQIVRSVAELQDYCVSNPSVVMMLWQSTLLFSQAPKHDLTNEVVAVVEALVKLEERLSEQGKQVLQPLLNEFTRLNYCEDSVCKVLSLFTIKGDLPTALFILQTV